MRFKSLLVMFLIIVTALCGRSDTEPQVTVLPEDTASELSSIEHERRLVYEFQFENTACYVLADGSLYPVVETSSADLYRACNSPIVVWVGDTEVFITDSIMSDIECNSYLYNDVYFVTSDMDFDFSRITTIVVEKLADDNIIETQFCELDDTAEDDLYGELFPDYNSSDVYSYAKAELSDGSPIVVLQRVTGNGISYEYLGVDSSKCNLTASSQLVVGDLEEVIELDFCANPNYKQK